MKKISTEGRLLYGSTACFGLMAASFILMAPWSGKLGYSPLDTVAGVLFWAGGLLGLALQLPLWSRCQKKAGRRKGLPGALRFCRTPLGTAADIAAAVSAAGFGLSMRLTNNSGKICYFFLAFTVFSLVAHCIFNGKCYNYIQRTIALKEENQKPTEKPAGTRRK